MRAARERAAALRDDDGRKLARAEFARFALAEIDAAAIEDDAEDERLRERRDVLANAERVVAALAIASAALEDDAAAVDALGAAETRCWDWRRYAERFAELASAAGALQSDANELAARIARRARRGRSSIRRSSRPEARSRARGCDGEEEIRRLVWRPVRAQRDAFAPRSPDVDRSRRSGRRRTARSREQLATALGELPRR